MDRFKAQALLKDADAIVGLAVLALLLLVPDAAYARVAADPLLFGSVLATILGGRYALRTGGALAAGRSGAHVAGPELRGTVLSDADLDELEQGS